MDLQKIDKFYSNKWENLRASSKKLHLRCLKGCEYASDTEA